MTLCPKCGERLGIFKMEEKFVTPGTLVEHIQCKAVLMILEAPWPELRVRLATPAEMEKQ